MEKVRIEAELPAALAAQARAFVAEGCANDLDDLLGGSRATLPRVPRLRVDRSLHKEDVQWGFMETTETGLHVVCDAGPVIHLDELGCIDLLHDFPHVIVPATVRGEIERHRPAALLRSGFS